MGRSVEKSGEIKPEWQDVWKTTNCVVVLSNGKSLVPFLMKEKDTLSFPACNVISFETVFAG